MSYYDDDDDDDGNGQKPNPLRKVTRDLEKKLAAEEKARQEAEDKLAKATRALNQRNVADVLKDKGADPRLAKYVIRDLEDEVTPESVVQWLNTDGELFGYKPATPQGPDAVAQAFNLPAGTVLPPDLVAAYEQFAASQQGGTTSQLTDPIAAKLNDPNLTREQLEALIYSS